MRLTWRVRSANLSIGPIFRMKTQNWIALAIALAASVSMFPSHANAQETTLSKAQIKALMEKAEKGDDQAQRGLGDLYYSGQGVTQDYGKAAEWYRKSAEQGEARAQFALGGLYYSGKGVTQDYGKAAEWYRKSAEQGNADAQWRLGALYYSGEGVTQDYGKAAEWCRKSAEQGNAAAQCLLGNWHYWGLGVTQVYGEAVEWYRKSAEQGNAVAQCRLGHWYYWGLGVTQDYGKAAEWCRKSAEQGYAVAQLGLGNLYYSGGGVTQDYGKAAEWYRKSAEQGDASAQYNLADLYYSGKGVTQDGYKAAEWYRKSAEQGNAVAQFALGMLYYWGMLVSKDYDKAAEWLTKANNHDVKAAEEYLSTIRSLQVEEQGEDRSALTIMRSVVDLRPTDNVCMVYIMQIDRILQRVIADVLADGQKMLDKDTIENRLARFDAVRDSIVFLVNKLEERLGNEDYKISDTKKILDRVRKQKELACKSRTSYVSFYVARPYLDEAKRLFDESENSTSPNNKWNQFNNRDKIREGVRLLTKSLNKELLEQSDQNTRDYVLSLKRQLKDLVYESEYNEFIAESTLWDSNDPHKKTGADAWWSSGKGARSNSW